MSSSGGGTPAVPTGPASGDLSGGYPAPVVSQVQGRPVSNAAPGSSQAFVWNGALWLPSAIVNNFAGRTGGIVPTTGDYTAAQVTNAADLSAAAVQTFTGTVNAAALGAVGTTGGGGVVALGVGNGNQANNLPAGISIGSDGVQFNVWDNVGGKGFRFWDKVNGVSRWSVDGAGNAVFAGSVTSSNNIFNGGANGVTLRPVAGTNNGALAGDNTGFWRTFSGAGVQRNVLDDGAGNAGFAGHIQTVFNLIPGNGAVAGGSLWSGVGAPAAGLGANGDFYFRTDGAAGTRIYYKSGGVWAGIV